jgi:hypothetical protein
MTVMDKRTVLGDQEKEEPKVSVAEVEESEPEQAAEPEEPEVIEPLGADYIKKVAEMWPTSAQGESMLPHLPKGLDEMLERQSEDFLLGFANAVQCVHDIGIKMLLDDLRVRVAILHKRAPDVMDASQLMVPSDRMIINAAAVTEGIGWLACKQFTDKTAPKKPEEPDKE